MAGLRVHTGAGLVEERDLGSADDGRGERETLALTAGQASHGGARERAEPEPLGELVQRARVGVHARDVLQHLRGGHAGRQTAVLEHHADPGAQLARVVDGVEPEHAHGARVGPAQALAALDRRRLAGTVRPQDGGDGAGPCDEVEAVDDGAVAVALDETGDLDGLLGDGGGGHGRRV